MIEAVLGREELHCKAGDMICKEGAYGNDIYKILSGAAAVYANYGKEDEKLLAELHEGEYFGEMAVIEITSRSATVIAAEDDTRIEVIDASDLSGYLSENKGEINGIARHMSSRLRKLTENYTEVCDTLRELGRMDTSCEKLSESLLTRIKKFARIYLMGDKTAEDEAEAEPELLTGKCDRGLALHELRFRRGDVAFREGEPSDCMYYIHEGRIGVFTGYGTERQNLLTELTSEMFFGEMGIFEGLRRTATAVALEDDTCAEVIREKDLDVLFDRNPTMALMVLQHLSSRLRRLTKDYLKACKALAAAEKEIETDKLVLSPEARIQADYINRLLLAPEILF